MGNQTVADKHLRPVTRVLSRMREIILVPALMLICASVVTAAEVNCNHNLSKAAINGLSKGQKRQIQSSLHEIFKQDPEYIEANKLNGKRGTTRRSPLADGIIGPVTLHWVQKFCADYSLDKTYLEAGAFVARNVSDALAHFAAITRMHPNWKAIVSSDRFQRWIDNQSELRKVEIYNVMRSGTAPLINSILDQFQDHQPQIPTFGNEGEGLISYKLTQDAIDDFLGGQELIKLLNELVDKPYSSRSSLWQAVEEKIIGVTKHANMYQDLIKQRAKKQTSLRLTDKSFETLKLRSTPDNILQPLQKLKDLPFKNEQRLRMAIILRFKQIGDATAKQSLGQASESGTEDATDAARSEDAQIFQKASHELKRLRDRVKNYLFGNRITSSETNLNDILHTAKPKTTFSLTKQSLDEIKSSVNNKDIPLSVARMLNSMASIEYANKALFVSALAAKAGQTQEYLAYLPKLIALARRDHKNYKQADIDWNGGLCGCVLDDLSGDVYGFYPYWLAEGQSQNLDFNVLTRIGYYAVSFDGKGETIETHQWTNETGQFLNAARMHRTKVDLVVYKHWSNFLEEYKRNEKLIESAAKSLVAMVNQELTSSFFNVIKPYISFGTSSIPTLGDGITLYLDQNPLREVATSKLFSNFIKALRAEIDKQNPKLSLNVIVPIETFQNPGPNGKYLTHLIPKVSENNENFDIQDYVDLFIVFLAEPTTKNKKDLRKAVENLFIDPVVRHDILGIQRRNLLRKLIPVVTFHSDSQDQYQLMADITYSEDNFAGIGFWPVPVKNEKTEKVEKAEEDGGGLDLARLLEQNYTANGDQSNPSNKAIVNYIQPSINSIVTFVQNIVCQYRWPFRILNNLLLIAALIFGYLYFFKCYRRCFRCFLGLIVLLVVVFLLRLFFDPYYSELAEGNALLIILIVAILAYAVYRYNEKRQQLP